jgi:hypothetical protein
VRLYLLAGIIFFLNTFSIQEFIIFILYTCLFSIPEILRHPVIHPGGFDAFATQPLCVGVPHLFPPCDGKTTLLFRSLSSIILPTCPYQLGALLYASLKSTS